MSTRLALFAWLLLVLYCEAVICCVYIWQVSWLSKFSSETTDLVGLQKYERGRDVWWGLFWHLFILLFSVIQWHVIQLNKKQQNAAGNPQNPFLFFSFCQVSEAHLRNMNLPKPLVFFILIISKSWQTFGIFLVYLALVLAAVLEELSMVGLLCDLSIFF